jgi:putative DNA primase/helicase
MEDKLNLGLTDLGNAERFSCAVQDKVRHSPIRGWMVWDGTKWQPGSNAEVYEMAIRTVKAISGEADDVPDTSSKTEIIKHAVRSCSKQSIDNMLSMAATMPSLSVSDDEMDSDPWLLAVANGVVNLRTGKMVQHRRDHYNSYACTVPYNPDAKRTRWLKFVHQVFGNQPELVHWVQKAMGYTLTGSTKEQCLFFLFGSGLNGKSTFVETFSNIMGNYAAHTHSETFMVRTSGTIRNDLARLVGKRMVVATEVPARKALDEVGVKSMTGEEAIMARFLHREYFEFMPQFKIWLTGNHKPSVYGTDFAIWRRIRIIPFTNTIAPDQIDRELRAKLAAEAEGILAWAIEGCQLWQLEGLQDVPTEVADATRRYREEQDVIGWYGRECCAVTKGLQIGAAELYAHYALWAKEQGEGIMTRQEFGRKLQERFPEVVKFRVDGEWLWSGVQLQKPIPMNAISNEEGSNEQLFV